MNLESNKLPRDTVDGKSHLETYHIFLHVDIPLIIDGLGLRIKTNFSSSLMAVS